MSKMTIGKISFQKTSDPFQNPIEKIRLRVLERKLEETYQELLARVVVLEHKVKRLERKK